MKIYLAARYSRRVELCGYRKQIIDIGHTVTSRWLNGEHQISDSGKPIGETGELLVEGDDESSSHCAAALRSKFQNEDFIDVITSELCISFTEKPRSGHSRGGRHVEFGIALGRMLRCWVIGHRENIFHWNEDVRFFETWEESLEKLKLET